MYDIANDHSSRELLYFAVFSSVARDEERICRLMPIVMKDLCDGLIGLYCTERRNLDPTSTSDTYEHLRLWVRLTDMAKAEERSEVYDVLACCWTL